MNRLYFHSISKEHETNSNIWHGTEANFNVNDISATIHYLPIMKLHRLLPSHVSEKKVFSVPPIYLESTSKNGCYAAALVTVAVFMTEHQRETVAGKEWLGCMGPLIMASFSISRHTVRQTTREGEDRAAVVCFMLGRKMKGTQRTKDQVHGLKTLSVLFPSTIFHPWKFSEFSKIAPLVGNYIFTK